MKILCLLGKNKIKKIKTLSHKVCSIARYTDNNVHIERVVNIKGPISVICIG